MQDKFRQEINMYDLIVHSDNAGVWVGVVVKVTNKSIKYIIARDLYKVFYKGYDYEHNKRTYRAQTSNRLMNISKSIIMETPIELDAPSYSEIITKLKQHHVNTNSK